MGPTQRFRSTFTRAVGWLCVGVAAATLVGLAVEHPRDLALFGGFVALLGLAGWALMVVPYVEVSDGGLVLRNPIRTVSIAWPAVQEVDGRYGLRLTTAYGKITAWAAPAPSGMARARREQSPVSRAVEARLDELRRAGHLENPRLESDAPQTRVDIPVVLAAAASALWMVIGVVTA